MRRVVFFFFLSIFVFAASFVFSRFCDRKLKASAPKPLASFEPAPFVLKKHPFVIVLSARNNGAYVEKTLHSLFFQSYENYRIVYVDDASDDGSFEVARDCLYASEHLPKIEIVKNEQRLGTLANLYRAVKGCQKEEIVIPLKQEDCLAHEWVLERLNAYFADPDLWMCLAETIQFPSYRVIPQLKGSRRELKPGHNLPAFYAALFQQIRESDLAQGGAFLPSAAELAYLTPLLEMGDSHVEWISEVFSVHNQEVREKEDREQTLQCERLIRSLEPYSPLPRLEVATWRD